MSNKVWYTPINSYLNIDSVSVEEQLIDVCETLWSQGVSTDDMRDFFSFVIDKFEEREY